MKNIFDESSGKYGVEWGNAAFIDCHYVYDLALDSMKTEIEEHPDWFKKPGYEKEAL